MYIHKILKLFQKMLKFICKYCKVINVQKIFIIKTDLQNGVYQ